MHGLPPGFEEIELRGVTVVARPGALPVAREAIGTAGSLHAWAGRHPKGEALRGRGVAHRVPAAGSAWVVRHYHRGGAVARVLGDRYLRSGDLRPMLELWASERARRRGVPTPAVQCVVIHPAGIFYRADIATLAVPDARDLADASFGPGALEGEALEAAWTAAGTLLRHAFAAGVDHADLNLMNVLLEPAAAGPRAWLIDLDRARVLTGELPNPRRTAILARFHRSRQKLAAGAGRPLAAGALAAFEAALAAPGLPAAHAPGGGQAGSRAAVGDRPYD